MTQPQIIMLTLVRETERRERCQHVHLEVDDDLAQVKCLECGQMLNCRTVSKGLE